MSTLYYWNPFATAPTLLPNVWCLSQRLCAAEKKIAKLNEFVKRTKTFFASKSHTPEELLKMTNDVELFSTSYAASDVSAMSDDMASDAEEVHQTVKEAATEAKLMEDELLRSKQKISALEEELNKSKDTINVLSMDLENTQKEFRLVRKAQTEVLVALEQAHLDDMDSLAALIEEKKQDIRLSWGENGYIKIQRGTDEKGGKCGILEAASQPSV